jgi:metal-responsive CopG/Arc/MetJ family transcriptional regulator
MVYKIDELMKEEGRRRSEPLREALKKYEEKGDY